MSEIKVLWDGGTAVVVEKPAGLSTIAPPGGDSLEARLQTQFADRSDYVHVAHRLDREVGGVLLVALQKKAARLLQTQFATRKVIKRYRAWVSGRVSLEPSPIDETVVWKDWMRKLPDEARGEICNENTLKAKLAETIARVLRYDEDHSRTLLELSPLTGRMHQLRLQTAHRGHPIVGDSLYGPPAVASEIESPIQLQSQLLTFHEPSSGKRVSVVLPLTPDWE